MKKPLHIGFRADSSLQIGFGHISRCLNIAEEFKKNGDNVVFICRDFENNAFCMIKDRGFNIISLDRPKKEYVYYSNDLKYISWLGVDIESEKNDLKTAIRDKTFDILFFDSYAMDFRLESFARNFAKQIVVIDDLYDRRHNADILIDATLGRNIDDYKNLVDESCELLLGANYQPLRSVFATFRPVALPRRFPPRSILISMGGIDTGDFTGEALKALAKSKLKDEKIYVVLSAAAPNIADRKKAARELDLNIEWRINEIDMPKLILESDLAIGAMGVSSYERASLGLATISWAVAENQCGNFNAFVAKNAIIPISDQGLEKTIEILSESEFRSCEIAAFNACDASGVKRIYERVKNAYRNKRDK
ncbi:MAG: UDP-2,4-diacetamido-2,4,6-trideoxy-beta-L-altropyranose hydrolase [Helicobacteraceae bacterium]|jgi:UDP-2,4-diacetamido-2,4,6-trideoxy-beta-L-altropyranose hydrolase|nr:UDP-2,4-diacetamido-2,4,6-trideoxy-beta-L-altropyranose hydrolase [Helicobacteraceae bacterium]